MPKQIYNEGRVVGYSAWELYTKQALAADPDTDPASEREWLAASIGNGSSMILKINANEESQTSAFYIDFEFPENTDLCAANTITASWFLGACETDSRGWATAISDYGQGISNTDESHPTSDNPSEYPTQEIGFLTQDEIKQLKQYSKIQDGVVLQPGTWVASDSESAYSDFIPDLTKPPILRIIFSETITEPFYILLTGFMHRSVINGISGLDSGSLNSPHPENGDFVGPEVYPWANKVIFTYPGIASKFLQHELLSTNNNLKIESSESGHSTNFTVSPILGTVGVSITQPTNPGDPVRLSSIIDAGNNYINVQLGERTRLTPSETNVGLGVAAYPPQNPGEPFQLSSIIGSGNKYIKVLQVAKQNTSSWNIARDETAVISTQDLIKPINGYTTLLAPSPITSREDYGVAVSGPQNPGDPVVLRVRMSSSNSNLLNINQRGYVTLLSPAEIISEDDCIDVVVEDHQVKLSVNTEKLLDKLGIGSYETSNVNDGTLWGLVKTLVAHINGISWQSGNDAKLVWPTSPANQKIPIGNMNIYSSNNKQITTHGSATNGDLKVN